MDKAVRFVRPDGSRYCQVDLSGSSVHISSHYDGKFYKFTDTINLLDKKDAKTVFDCICRYYREGTIYDLHEEEID